MRFSPMNPFIRAAERTHPRFNPLHEPEGQPPLPAPGATADRTVLAHAGQGQVQRGRVARAHGRESLVFRIGRSHRPIPSVESSLGFIHRF